MGVKGVSRQDALRVVMGDAVMFSRPNRAAHHAAPTAVRSGDPPVDCRWQRVARDRLLLQLWYTGVVIRKTSSAGTSEARRVTERQAPSGPRELEVDCRWWLIAEIQVGPFRRSLELSYRYTWPPRRGERSLCTGACLNLRSCSHDGSVAVRVDSV